MEEKGKRLINKITIIGAGNVGASCAQRLAERDYADVVIVDIIAGLPQGKALDIFESAPILKFNSCIIGTNDYLETADSDVVIITSGSTRKPGMTRDELLRTNMSIVAGVTRNVASHSPNCIIIVVTNPVEAMTYAALQVSRFPRSRVLGLSGVLDGARLSSFIAAELKVPVERVSSCILGQHGENMVILPRLCKVNGKPITELLPEETIDRLIRRTIKGGAEIIELLKAGSAFYAPSAAVAQMVDAIILDNKEVLHCSAYLNGEYGLKDTILTVPVKLGKNGIEQIIELELTEEEKQALTKAAETVRQLISNMRLG